MKNNKCPMCHGNGSYRDVTIDENVICDQCKGSGRTDVIGLKKKPEFVVKPRRSLAHKPIRLFDDED